MIHNRKQRPMPHYITLNEGPSVLESKDGKQEKKKKKGTYGAMHDAPSISWCVGASLSAEWLRSERNLDTYSEDQHTVRVGELVNLKFKNSPIQEH
jgi:hypothetical protein